MLPISAPLTQYNDNAGQPLNLGYLYFGQVNDNPETAPITVYWDIAGTQPAAQPIRTIGGYASRNGTPANVYSSANYSLLVKKSNGVQVFYGKDSSQFDAAISLNNSFRGSNGASLIGWTQAGIGSILRNLQSKVREIETSVVDFGAIGDGVTDDTAAVQAAYNASSLRVKWPKPSSYYRINGTITFLAEHLHISEGPTSCLIVHEDDSTWAFECDPVLPLSPLGDIAREIQGGGMYGLDIRAVKPVRIGTPNFSNPPWFDYNSFEAFSAASPAVHGYEVHDCVFMPRLNYSDGYSYVAASPGFNTLTPPTVADLYSRGGPLFSHCYRIDVRHNTIKFFGQGVWLFGCDIGRVVSNRIANCLRWINVQGTQTAGFQCTVSHNDLLASYRWGGIFTRWVNHTTIGPQNYMENTGAITNSTINAQIVDTGVCTTIVGNRIDDYGSTMVSGPLIVFNGPAGTICTENRRADNRLGGAGNLSGLSADGSAWLPGASGLFCGWGLVQMFGNENSFPRILHPLVQSHLDENPLYWSPLNSKRDLSYRDVSGGGIAPYSFFQDSNSLWYLNTGGFQNALNLKPRQDQLTKGLNYIVKVRSKNIYPSAGPYTAFWIISWINSLGVKTDIFADSKPYANNTAILEITQSVSIPAVSDGYFSVYVDPASANLYSIEIVEA